MGLAKIIQIPCHHVLANQNDLKLKKGVPTFGIGIMKKLLFLFVFSTYLPMFLLKFWLGHLVRCRIKFRIQWALSIEIWVKTQRDMSKIRTKKVVFLWQICHFNHYGWLILLEFHWFLNSNSREHIVGAFSYKAHFRPQISSNGSRVNDCEPCPFHP